MPQRLTRKVAIVTGASRGIGRAIAVGLGAEGATVVLSGRSAPNLQTTAEKVTAAGGAAEMVPAELADEDSIRHLVRATEQRHGRIDILVNNAGVTHSAPLEETKTEDLDRCWAVNARAPFILCREALPLLKKAERGYIINIASVVAVKGYPLQSAYTASKHALRGMSMALAEELRSSNVRVHVICPGGVDTELVARVRPDLNRADLIGPDELAELVVYLVAHRGNAVLDELHVRRATAAPWFVS
jgi:NAD(P)-dependent dehydrogenase (short-subunit alcohol dehydrogenase family)